jgi:hypothetical protein
VNPAFFNLAGEGGPERIEGATCTWRLFQVLGVEPQLGGTFVENHNQPGANRFVVVGDSLWRRWLGAEPGVIGNQSTSMVSRILWSGSCARTSAFRPERELAPEGWNTSS